MIKFKTLAITIVVIVCSCAAVAAQTLTYNYINTLTVNEKILTITPKISDGSFNKFSVEPSLPQGLSLNTSNGNIDGTPSTVSNREYTITATNGLRSAAFLIIINIIPAKPNFNYNTTYNFQVGTAVTGIVSRNTGGTGKFSSNKALPAGLALDEVTGEITGTPSAYSPPTAYLITCKNSSGSYSFSTTITVEPATPALSYSPSAYEFTTDSTIDSITPTNTASGFSHYTIDSALHLPKGLSLNSATGVISGTPTEAVHMQSYTIIATNNKNEVGKFQINIAVASLPDLVKTPTSIRFVGEGSIQQSINNSSKLPANTGLGVIYRQASSRRYGVLHNIEVDFSINVASTVDTVKSINDTKTNEVKNRGDFGTSVLLPINSGQAFAFHFTGYLTERGGPAGNYRRNLPPKPLGGVISGFRVSVIGSNRNWQYNSNDDVKTMVKASLLSTYAGVFYEFITPEADNNYGKNASITLGAGYSARWILGDVQQPIQNEIRERLLGSDRRAFNGFELNLGLRFYNIKAEVRLPFLRSKDNIPGLSGAQPNYFIGFSGGFPIDLKKKGD